MTCFPCNSILNFFVPHCLWEWDFQQRWSKLPAGSVWIFCSLCWCFLYLSRLWGRPFDVFSFGRGRYDLWCVGGPVIAWWCRDFCFFLITLPEHHASFLFRDWFSSWSFTGLGFSFCFWFRTSYFFYLFLRPSSGPFVRLLWILGAVACLAVQ